MIPLIHRGENASALLTYLYGLGTDDTTRLIGGDCHGAPIDQLSPADLAQALDALLKSDHAGVHEKPVLRCTIDSVPDLPDPTDSQWAAIARRVVSATGIAPDGDPDACRWIALRTKPRQVHIAATLVREDGQPVPSLYRLPAAIWAECGAIATEHTARYPLAPITVRPTADFATMPALTVSIGPEPSGSVVARGGDSLAKSLLTHAGFAFANDWHGPRHRLPTTMSRDEQAAISSHAAGMLRAARYAVELDPALDTDRADPLRGHSLGDQVVALTDRIRGAESGAELADALAPLLHAEHGFLERVREALEAAGEQITDLNDDEYALADRFGFAVEFVSSAESELLNADEELRRVAVAPHEPGAARSSAVYDARSAALSTSPAASKASATRDTSPPTPVAAPPAGPTRNSPSRTR